MMVDLAITVLYNGFEGGSIGDPQVYYSSLRSHIIQLNIVVFQLICILSILHAVSCILCILQLIWHSVQYTALVLIEVP